MANALSSGPDVYSTTSSGGGGGGGLFSSITNALGLGDSGINLGIGNEAKNIMAIPGGLISLAGNIAGAGEGFVTGNTQQLNNDTSNLATMGTAMLHGLADTGVDVASMALPLGVPMTSWNGTALGLENITNALTGYRPKTVGEYATDPNSQGLLPAVLNDVSNVAAVAAPAAKLAALGDVGKVAAAGEAAAAAAAPEGAAAAAEAGRLSAASEIAGSSTDAAKLAEQAAGRAKLLNNLDIGAHPWRELYRQAVRPVGRAILQSRIGEMGADLGAEVAPAVAQTAPGAAAATEAVLVPQGATAGATAAQAATGAVQTATAAVSPLQAAQDAVVAADKADYAGRLAREGSKTLYRAEDPNALNARLSEGAPAPGLSAWTDNLADAKGYAANTPGAVVQTAHIPTSVADEALAEAGRAGTHPGGLDLGGSEYHVPNDIAEQGKLAAADAAAAKAETAAAKATPNAEATAAEVASNAAPGVAEAPTPTNEPLTPAMVRSQFNNRTTPEWAQMIASRLPGPLRSVMGGIEQLGLRSDTNRVLRENTRAIERMAAEATNTAPVQAALDTASNVLRTGNGDVSRQMASNLVGERVFARAQLEPGFYDLMQKSLDNGTITPERFQEVTNIKHALPSNLDTPEFRQAIQHASELYAEQRGSTLERMRGSSTLGDTGLENVGKGGAPIPNANQRNLLGKATQSNAEADRLEANAVPKERAQIAKQIAAERQKTYSADATARRQYRKVAQNRQVVQDMTGPTPMDSTHIDTTVQDIVDQTQAHNGVTYDMWKGTPATDGAYAISASSKPLASIPVEQWATEGPDALKKIATEQADILRNPDMKLSTAIHADPTTGQQIVDVGFTHSTWGGRDLTRGQAVTLAAARGQSYVRDLVHQGDIAVPHDPESTIAASHFVIDALKPNSQFSRWMKDAYAKVTDEAQAAVDRGRVPEANAANVDAAAQIQMRSALQAVADGHVATTEDYFKKLNSVETPGAASNLSAALTRQVGATETIDRLIRPPAGMEALAPPELGVSLSGKSVRQVARMIPTREGESTFSNLRRGITAGQASSDVATAQQAIKDQLVVKARAQSAVRNLEDVLRNNVSPQQLAANKLRAIADKASGKVTEELKTPTNGQIPDEWRPLHAAFSSMAKDAETNPTLLEAMHGFASTWQGVLDRAKADGWDPTKVPDMSESKVRSMAEGNARLGGNEGVGKQVVSSMRKKSTGALSGMGMENRSIELMTAALVNETQEARTNAVVNWIKDTQAFPIPAAADGAKRVLPKGFKEWDPTRRGLLGIDTSNGRVATDQARYMIPDQVYRSIKAYGSPGIDNPIINALRKPQSWWKALIMTASPSFYMKHFAGHVILGMAAGATPKDWLGAFKIAKGHFADMPAVIGQGIMGEMEKGGSMVQFDRGLQGVRQAYLERGVRGAVAEVTQNLHNAVSAGDSLARAASVLHDLRKGADMETALQHASDALIDYGDLNPFEKSVMKAIVPFYGFQKGMLKVALRMPLDHPIAAGVLDKIGQYGMDQQTKEFGKLPSYDQGLITLPIIGTVRASAYNPFRDVTSLTTPEGIIKSLNPILGIGIQQATQRKFDLGTALGQQFNSLPQASALGGLLGTNNKSPGQGVANFFGLPTLNAQQISAAQAAAAPVGPKSPFGTQASLPLGGGGASGTASGRPVGGPGRARAAHKLSLRTKGFSRIRSGSGKYSKKPSFGHGGGGGSHTSRGVGRGSKTHLKSFSNSATPKVK